MFIVDASLMYAEIILKSISMRKRHNEWGRGELNDPENGNMGNKSIKSKLAPKLKYQPSPRKHLYMS